MKEQTQLHGLEQAHEVEVQYNTAASWTHCLVLARAPPVLRLTYGDDNNRDDHDNDTNTRCY